MISTLEIDDRINKCQKILDADPNSQIFAALAEAYRKKGELDRAFKVCRNGLKVHLKYGSAHLVMAKINLDRGLYDWAEIEVQKSAEIDGKTRAVELLMAEIHIYKGEFSKAIRLLRKLHQSDPTNDQVKKLLDIAEKIPIEQTLIHAASQEKMKPVVKEPAVLQVEKRKSEPVIKEPLDILKDAITFKGIDGALFLNNEGLIVEKEWVLQMDSEVCGANMVEISKNLNAEMIQNSFGNISTILIETENLNFYQVVTDPGIYLFIAQSGTNLGSLRMKIENLFGNK